MADYALVHGGNMSVATWNKLTVDEPVSAPDGTLGPHIWDKTIAFLAAHGHRAFAPALADESTGSLTMHIAQVCSLIDEHDLHNVILVGHSYGGMVITGVADLVPERICRLVYLDAALPDPGQSLYDLLRLGLSAAHGKVPALPDPSPPFIEKLQFDPARVKQLQKTYILCTKSDFFQITRIAREKIAADPENWTYVELPSSHVPMADMPDEFNRLMLDAAAR